MTSLPYTVTRPTCVCCGTPVDWFRDACEPCSLGVDVPFADHATPDENPGLDGFMASQPDRYLDLPSYRYIGDDRA